MISAAITIGTTPKPSRYCAPMMYCSRGIQPTTQRNANSVKIRKYFIAAA